MAAKTGQIYAARTGAGTALPIVPVRVKSKSSDKFVETYAFLDSGSTATFCSDRVLHLLGIEGKKTILNLTTLGNKQKQTTREVRGLEISSLDGEHTIELPPVFTQPSLPLSRADVPSEEDVTGLPHLRDLELERIDSEVDLLIGVNVPKAMEPWDIIASKDGGPFAIKTLFGWVVNGPLEVSGEDTESFVQAHFIKGSASLEEQVRDHFNKDFPERSIDDKLENSKEDCQLMESMKQSHKQNDHFFVNLPFKHQCVAMPNNKKQAEQRLTMLLKRFDKDARFREAYNDFMNKVIEKGYAHRVSPDDKPEDGKVWYLPHHGVFHPKKNKIRVVFDCAARYGGTSLNDQLLQGPNLTNTLVGTLTRFRQDEVAVIGDIENMFYQVHVSASDRNFQRFF